MTQTPPCTARHLNHVCIAVRDIKASLQLYRDVFNLDSPVVEDIADQGVLAALIKVGSSQLEFIQPTDPDSAVARFIQRRDEGLHHVCFEVEDLPETLKRLDASDVELIDSVPREGLSGMIAFIHPGSTGGTLIELVDQDSARR